MCSLNDSQTKVAGVVNHHKYKAITYICNTIWNTDSNRALIFEWRTPIKFLKNPFHFLHFPTSNIFVRPLKKKHLLGIFGHLQNPQESSISSCMYFMYVLVLNIFQNHIYRYSKLLKNTCNITTNIASHFDH